MKNTMDSGEKKNIYTSLEDSEQTALICRALASPVRLDILRKLVSRSMSISELAAEFYLPVSSISMHIRILKDAGLINVVKRPGIHGMQKVCGIQVGGVDIDLFSRQHQSTAYPPISLNIPVGCYSDCQITPPCGIASASKFISAEDTPYGFYSPEHMEASILWFTAGYVEYHIPNKILLDHPLSEIEFSFEICSEAPGWNNNWPSDITFRLNQQEITSFMTKGDYGGRRGIYTPTWWNDGLTQFGEYRRITVTDHGTFLDNSQVSDATWESLGLLNDYYFSLSLGVDENARYVGGMNLLGSSFGDYAQDIVMKATYKKVNE
jgi:predicted transcriptional regulator